METSLIICIAVWSFNAGMFTILILNKLANNHSKKG
jgi:hypothetical protein